MVDLAIVGAGAAGLMAGIWAGRSGRCGTIVAFDGARKLGAKILIAGGGRCNVTHERVEAGDFNGSSQNAIRRILRRFDVEATRRFFEEIGVELKREETGKLFPVTDQAPTVLDALLLAARSAGVEIVHPCRIVSLQRVKSGFELRASDGRIFHARRVILATGGRSVPKTGSDGGGYELAKALGHSLTPRIVPALVPLILEEGSPLRALSGVSAPVRLSVRDSGDRRVRVVEGALLCTHFGISGPAVLDVSRSWILARAEDGGARLTVDWLPSETREGLDAGLRELGPRGPARFLSERMPERLARFLCASAGVDPGAPGHMLSRDSRRRLVSAIFDAELPVTGERGFAYAEATAGGVPLSEIRLETMESRLAPGLHLCGEICDVDGRIGGFNFQWAWSSGFVAGVSASPEPSSRLD